MGADLSVIRALNLSARPLFDGVQRRRLDGFGQRLSLYDRRRGAVLRHGPRWQEQYLCFLAIR